MTQEKAAQEGIVFQCKCGHRVRIPPGRERQEGRCPNCLAIIKPRDILKDQDEDGAKAGKKKAKRKGKQEPAKPASKPVLLRSDETGLTLKCKCGRRLTVPKNQQEKPVRCPACFVIIKPGELLMDPKEKKRKKVIKPKKYVYNPYADVDPAEFVTEAIKWSGAGGLCVGAAGAVGGAMIGPMFSEMDAAGPAVVWGFFGTLLGILVFGTWGITKAANLGMGRCILVGITLGTMLAAVDWVFETFLITLTDATALSCFAVGMMGGVVTGLAVSLIQHPISEDDIM